jgi:tetratricopeptide (TPR) repeat protein
MAEKTNERETKQRLYRESAGWLERLSVLTRDPFHRYQQGRVYLLLGDRAEAHRCFDEAARRLPDDSIYKAPATKLARKLAP